MLRRAVASSKALLQALAACTFALTLSAHAAEDQSQTDSRLRFEVIVTDTRGVQTKVSDFQRAWLNQSCPMPPPNPTSPEAQAFKQRLELPGHRGEATVSLPFSRIKTIDRLGSDPSSTQAVFRVLTVDGAATDLEEPRGYSLSFCGNSVFGVFHIGFRQIQRLEFVGASLDSHARHSP